MCRNRDRIDTYQLIDHGIYWNAKITRATGGGHSMTYSIGPYLSKRNAKRCAKRELRRYVVRHKIGRVRDA